MDRKLRRDLSKRKWISRAKKIYNSYRNLNFCNSITEFLNNFKCIKILKKCTSPRKNKIIQQEYKQENRKDRYKAKKDIQNSIQEFQN